MSSHFYVDKVFEERYYLNNECNLQNHKTKVNILSEYFCSEAIGSTPGSINYIRKQYSGPNWLHSFFGIFQTLC